MENSRRNRAGKDAGRDAGRDSGKEKKAGRPGSKSPGLKTEGDEPAGRGSRFSGKGEKPFSGKNKKSTDNKFDSRDEPAGRGSRFSGKGDKPFSGKNKKTTDNKFDSRKETSGSRSDSDKTRGFRKEYRKPASPSARKTSASGQEADGLIRLNKYIANSGICSRREADELILAGVVMVNGKVVTELGTKISAADKVQYDNQTIRSEKHQYVLLNKPKGYITTTDDPFDRKTVMALVSDACKERIYPVGRLDRNTTGLLLLTNDGELAKKLTHPKHKVTKIYHVELDKPLTKKDMLQIAEGVELEDGIAQVDEISYEEGASKREIGVQLHSGKNRIVRRIFEAVGYEVVRLDRVMFAGLTKKDLPRGKWRMLTDKEISYLKMLR